MKVSESWAWLSNCVAPLRESVGLPAREVKVTAQDSYASGKSVEVDFVKPDGTIKTTWEGKNVYVPKGGYQLKIKNIQNLSKKA